MTNQIPADTELISFPDNIAFNEDGEYDEQRIKRAIGILNHRHASAVRKTIKSQVLPKLKKKCLKYIDHIKTPSVLEFYSLPAIRSYIYFREYHRLLAEKKPSTQPKTKGLRKGVQASLTPSFELRVFNEYYPGYYKDKGEEEEKIQQFFLERLRYLKSSDELPDIEILRGFKALWEKLEKDLAQWAELSEERKAEVANVAFSLGTVTGAKCFKVLMELQPALTGCYTWAHAKFVEVITQLEARQKPRVSRKQETVESVESPELALRTVYEKVKDLSEQGLNQLDDGEIAKQLQDQVGLIPGLQAALPKLSIDWTAFIEAYCGQLVAVASKHEIEDLSHAEAQEYLKAAVSNHLWNEACINSEFVPSDRIAELGQRISDTAAGIKNIGQNVMKKESELHDISNLKPSSVKERRAAQERIIGLQSEINQMVGKRLNLEEDLLRLFLPENLSLDDFLDRTPLESVETRETSILAAVVCDNILKFVEASGTEGIPSDDLSTEPRCDEGGQEAISTTEIAQTADLSPPEDTNSASADDEDGELGAHADTLVELDIAEDLDTAVEEVESGEPEIEIISKIPVDYEIKGPEALESLMQAIERKEPVPAYIIEALALNTIESLGLPSACWMLRRGGELIADDTEIVPHRLLRAAYLGSQVWSRNSDVLAEAQRYLSQIPPSQLESWLNKRPGGKAVGYMLLVASLQPTLLGGNQSSAPLVLSHVRHLFGEAITSLAGELLECSNRGLEFSLKDLRDNKKQQIMSIEDIKISLAKWKYRISSKKRNLHTVRKAFSQLLRNHVIGSVVKTIEQNSYYDKKNVNAFVEQYQSPEYVEEMFRSAVDGNSEGVNGESISIFYGFVGELRQLAQDWLLNHGVRSNSAVHADQASRIVTLLKSTLESLRGEAKTDRTREVQVCAAWAAHTIEVLLGERETGAAWSSEIVRLWYSLPGILIEHYAGDSAQSSVIWLATETINGLQADKIFQDMLDKERYEVSKLLLEKGLVDSSKERKQLLDHHFNQSLSKCQNLSNQVERRVDNAWLEGMIDEDQRNIYANELNGIQAEIGERDIYNAVIDLLSRINEIDTTISSLTSKEVKNLTKAFDEEFAKLNSHFDANHIPDTWEGSFNKTLNNGNISVAEEMIDQMKVALTSGEPVKIHIQKGAALTKDFCSKQHEAYLYFRQETNPKTIARAISDDSPWGISYENKPSNFKKAFTSFLELRTQGKPRKSLDRSSYGVLVSWLELIGIKPAHKDYHNNLREIVEYEVEQGFIYCCLPIEKCGSQKPFPLLGSQQEYKDVAVMIPLSEWTPEYIDNVIQQRQLYSKFNLVIAPDPVSPGDRSKFAGYCKNKALSVFLVDPVFLAYFGSLSQKAAGNVAIDNFLRLSAPWTYYNPYRMGDTRYPPPKEMRYGRVKEISSLGKMTNGHAIVHGGRQLGKSTVLNEVQSSFHNPDKGLFAFYHLMDPDIMERWKDLDRKDWDQAQEMVWRRIYLDFAKYKLLKPSDFADVDTMRNAIKQALTTHSDIKVMIIFDEIDPLLAIDNAFNFTIFRGLRELVNKVEFNGRFKLIIAGLQNVKRFEDSPNYPLPQLGATLQISIMDTADAVELVNNPLSALGYEFENEMLANRILSITNRHPSLIQIFCHELVDSISKTFTGEVPRIITEKDVVRTESNVEVRAQIQKRFDMTLNLDQKYGIIVYSLLLEGIGNQSFSVRHAKTVAETFLPDEFMKLSETQFEAYLIELEGLGVLRKLSTIGGAQYSLRSTNVIRLLGAEGDDDTVSRTLQRYIDDYEENDPLERHAYDESEVTLNPLSFRDEKALAPYKDKNNKELGYSRYSVSMLAGSKALGIDTLETALHEVFARYDERLPVPPKASLEYQLIRKNDSDGGGSIGAFKTLLERLKVLSKQAPRLVLLDVGGEIPSGTTAILVDIALAQQEKDFMNPVRIVFLLSPKAYFNWLVDSHLTKSREDLISFINLSRWGHGACSYLLERLDMLNSSLHAEEVVKHTSGWYVLLEAVAKLKSRSKKAVQISDLTKYTPITASPPKKVRTFLEYLGLESTPWAINLVIALNKEMKLETFSEEIVEIVVDEHLGEEIDPKFIPQALEWLNKLGIIQAVRSEQTEAANYQLDSIVADCLESIGD